MNILLFISISMFTVAYSFVFLQKKIQIRNLSRNKMIDNDDYFTPPSNYEYLYEEHNYIEEPLYIVIWQDNEKTQNLLLEMQMQGLETFFIEDTFTIWDENVRISTKDMPLVYKDDVLLESWMDIYAEMYPM